MTVHVGHCYSNPYHHNSSPYPTPFPTPTPTKQRTADMQASWSFPFYTTLYWPRTLLLTGFLLCSASPWESNSAVSSIRDKERTFSMSCGDKSWTPVTPNSSFVSVKFCSREENVKKNNAKRLLHIFCNVKRTQPNTLMKCEKFYMCMTGIIMWA